MAQQGTQTNTTSELTDLIKVGEFFLQPENLHKKYDNFWDYDKIYFLLRSWAREINPNLDENPPLSEIIEVLSNPTNTQAILESNSINPVQLQYLEEEASKASELGKEAIEIAQRKKRAFMEFLLRQARIRNNHLDFLNSSLQKLTKSPIEPDQSSQIAQAISDNLQVDHSYLIEAIKAEASSDPGIEQDLLERQKVIWEAAVDKAAVKLPLSQKQIDFLKSLAPVSVFEEISDSLKAEAPTSAQEPGTLYEAPISNRKVTATIEKVIGPTSSEVEKTVRKIAPFVYVNIQSDPTISGSKSLSEKEIRDLRIKIQNEAVLSLAQVAPKLVEDGITLTPAETTKVLATFSLTDDQIRQLSQTPLFLASQLEKAAILQPQSISPIETEQNLPIIKTLATATSPFYLRTESGETVGRELRHTLLEQGINRETVPALEKIMDCLGALEVTAAGLSPQSLKNELDARIRAGLPQNSPEAKELRELISLTESYAKENPLLQTRIPAVPKPGVYPLRSENGIVVVIKNESAARGIKSFRGKPEAKFILSTVVLVTSRAAFLRKNIGNFIKNIFWKTGLGKNIYSALHRQSLNALQKLFSLSFTTREGLVFPGINLGSAASKIAETSFSTRFLGPIGEGLASTISGQNRTFNRMSSSFQDFLSSFSNPASFTTNLGKWMFGGIAILVILVFVVIFVASGSFNLNQSGMGGNSPGSNPKTQPPDCKNPRHFAEQVFCTIAFGGNPAGSPPCNHHFVNRDTMPDVTSCLLSSNLTNKELINGVFTQSTWHNGGLQCPAFVDAMQKALGKDMGNIRDACSYYTNPPAGYTLIQGTEKPQVGDVAVWNGTICGGRGKDPRIANPVYGHIVIVIAINGNIKFSAVEANGNTGEIRIVQYSYGHPDNDTDPNGFLR